MYDGISRIITVRWRNIKITWIELVTNFSYERGEEEVEAVLEYLINNWIIKILSNEENCSWIQKMVRLFTIIDDDSMVIVFSRKNDFTRERHTLWTFLYLLISQFSRGGKLLSPISSLLNIEHWTFQLSYNYSYLPNICSKRLKKKDDNKMLDVIKEILEGCNKNVAVLAIVGSLIVGKSVLNVSSFFLLLESCKNWIEPNDI